MYNLDRSKRAVWCAVFLLLLIWMMAHSAAAQMWSGPMATSELSVGTYGGHTSLSVNSNRLSFSSGGTNASELVADQSYIRLLTGDDRTGFSLSNSGLSLSSTSGAVAVSGVQAGTADTDAVNVSQLKAIERLTLRYGDDITNLSNQAGVHGKRLQSLEAQVSGLEQRLTGTERKMSGGIAMAMAMSQIPSPVEGQSFTLGLAAGHYNGETAFAIGGTARLGDNIVMKAAASRYNSQNGAAIGFGYGW